MTTITPKALGVLLGCGTILQISAFFAAYPVDAGRRKTLNIISGAIGFTAILVVTYILYQYR